MNSPIETSKYHFQSLRDNIELAERSRRKYGEDCSHVLEHRIVHEGLPRHWIHLCHYDASGKPLVQPGALALTCLRMHKAAIGYYGSDESDSGYRPWSLRRKTMARTLDARAREIADVASTALGIPSVTYSS